MPKMIKKLFKVDLQMFNDGGASGASGAEASTASTENAPKVETKQSGSNRRSKAGEFDNVVFGKQEGTASAEATSLDTEGNPTGAGKADATASDSLEARQKAYNDFINEYKDIDQKRFQETFDRRFKQVKSIEAELASQKPIIDLLKNRYRVEELAELQEAVQGDIEFRELVAERRGLTSEQLDAMERLEIENAEFHRARKREIAMVNAQRQVDAWHEEGKAVKQLYPSFDIKAELQNQQFVDMLKRGVGVEHAYKIIHFDELNQNAARVAAQTADAQAQARIKSKASRPSENGTSSKSAVIVKNDVSTLTRAERAEIARRVSRGEKISF